MKKSTIMLVTVLFMIIGYAAYNATVNIYGLGKISENISDFKVYLDNLKVNDTESTGINSAKDEFTIDNINGNISVDIVNDSTEYDTESYLECESNVTPDKNEWIFDYTGGEQTFTAPVSGTYKLETWGAQGGTYDASYAGGKGGYATGNINLDKNQKLFVNIGQVGTCVTATGTSRSSYNGGAPAKAARGAGFTSCSGGGATHIALSSGQLFNLENNINEILIVSGGGGGSTYRTAQKGGYFSGGSAGGYIGNTTTGHAGWSIIYSTGGDQNRGGTGGCLNGDSGASSGSFGQSNSCTSSNGSCSSGGGGFYGGGSGNDTGGGGGSGYIGNTLLTEKTMYCYNCATSSEESTKTVSTTCTSATPTENCAKVGNGYARITLTSSNETEKTSIEPVTIEAQDRRTITLENINTTNLTCKLKVNKISRTEKVYKGPTEWVFDYSGGEQVFTAPVDGTYKLETWGAQGGSNWYGEGGFGGYSIGNINLNINTKLFINVGSKTGYNGGNYMSGVEAPGGGATHISTIMGLLSSLENYKSNVLIVSGGGGAGERENGGSGGGYIGGTGYVLSNSHLYFGTGGTQSSGGVGVLSGKYTNNLYDINGSFGTGGIGIEKSDNGPNGGGGYYGGGATTLAGGAGGGSGYIGNPLLTEKSMHCYNCAESTEESTKTISTTCVNETPTENCSKQGNGYARITLISQN